MATLFFRLLRCMANSFHFHDTRMFSCSFSNVPMLLANGPTRNLNAPRKPINNTDWSSNTDPGSGELSPCLSFLLPLSGFGHEFNQPCQHCISSILAAAEANNSYSTISSLTACWTTRIPTMNVHPTDPELCK